MVDPRFCTDPVTPPFAEQRSLLARLGAEVWDHLWPWRRDALEQHRTLHAIGWVISLVVTGAWLLAATGQLQAGPVIGWWFAWSVLEVLVRMRNKRYVKEGRWWGSTYRVATPMDMICYVGFKNLLIGAALFLLLKSVGLLQA